MSRLTTKRALQFITSGILAAVLAGLFAGQVAVAHKGATGVLKTRMEGMKAMAGALKTVGTMARGLTPYDKSKVSAAANIIAVHTRVMIDLFPQGSDHAPSRALPSVWANQNGFAMAARMLEQAAAGLGAPGNGVEDLRLNVRSIGAACSACHKTFRAPEG